MADAPSRADEIRRVANELAEAMDADFFVLNFEILTPIDLILISEVGSRSTPKKNIVLFLTTEGGSADAAFRMMRFLQSRYEKITVAVVGWCKSAGTLMCIGAHELLIGDSGELGPLDVQIVKADEMDEQKSGLVAEAAFEKLQQEAYKFFMSFVRDIGGSEYRVTLKTASDIAAKLTVGVIQPIFDKLDPVTIGEDYRSNRLAQAYAERLNSHSKNLKRSRELDALTNLLSGYPSHAFCIDAKEAAALFKTVKPFPAEMVPLVNLLGMEMVLPRNSRSEQGPRLEFLNDETESASKGASRPDEDAGTVPERNGPRNRRDRPGQLPGNPAKGSGEDATAGANGTTAPAA